MDTTTETDLLARQRANPNTSDALLSEKQVLAIPTSADRELLHARLSGLRAELDRAAIQACSA
ncbi:hypothetical protein [Nocardia bhagyanarayanae]|uniref:Uncharacterized protein n=1 Tax=Nocardia bhagyanarayanae TaxID=1215925 RepID=A0A543FFR4_9NOCA|nr:hypothetical protein [Nocardia bhagyanarayanae]TQM32708.1 hypothetical protein FB390_4404 [Nocardia bhagyanarayanae]